MTQIRRQFGWVDDATVGGSNIDTLRGGPTPDPTVEPTIPDASQMWPVTNASVDKGIVLLERNDEVRGRRGNTPPLEFRQAPVVTVSGRLYHPIMKKLIALVTGGTPATTGTAPAALTRAYLPIGYGNIGLPAVHLSVVRDDQYDKIAGCQLAELALNFPLDDDATFEATFVGLYRRAITATPPAVDFSYLSPAGAASEFVYMLRDAQAFIDGSVSSIGGLRGYSLTFNNGLEDPDFWAMRNRLIKAATGTDRERLIWWPQRRKLGSAQTVTGQIMFSDVQAAEEAAHDLSRARQTVFEATGGSIATTPVARNMFRTTAYKTVYTGGGASALQRDGDVTTTYDFGVYVDESIGSDVKFELVEQ